MDPVMTFLLIFGVLYWSAQPPAQPVRRFERSEEPFRLSLGGLIAIIVIIVIVAVIMWPITPQVIMNRLY